MHKAWSMTDPERALRELQALARWLDERHPGAAGSLREGMEETLTINRLEGAARARQDDVLDQHHRECDLGRPDRHAHVKRWRNGKMIERWYAVGLQHAAKKFRKVKGYKEIPILVAALAKLQGIDSEKGASVA